MDVHVSIEGPGDKSARIYRRLRDAVLEGTLRPGERLPPTRELARTLGVSRNTVATAYERLTADGFLEARVGSGTFVTEGLDLPRPARSARPAGVRPRALWRSPPPVADTAPPPVFDFRVGHPDGTLFPLPAWRRVVSQALRPSIAATSGYADPAGPLSLRDALTRHLALSRSVRADAGDVVVTQGAQQALDLLGRVLIEPGDLVAVEEPGYPPARRLFHSLGARVTGVPVDGEGLDVSAIPDGARLVYVTPSHQFPLGMPMSLARRLALLDWAERAGAVVIEDDYDCEFRSSARPLDPLQSLDPHGRVCYVGTFSKTLVPSLRVGFVVAPPSLVPALRGARQLSDWHGDVVTQSALAAFLDEGHLARHVRRAVGVYAARHALVVATLERDFATGLRVVPSAAGLHLCATVSDPAIDVPSVVRRARARGVAVNTIAEFAAGHPAPDGLALGYGAVPVERIGEGLTLLREAL